MLKTFLHMQLLNLKVSLMKRPFRKFVEEKAGDPNSS